MSRVKIADKCALAYDYQYVQKVPAPYEKARTVFGTVVHQAVEAWYGPEGSTAYQSQPLNGFVHDGWFEHLPWDVATALRRTITAGQALDAVANAIQLTRDVKAPRQTKAFLTSSEYQIFEDARTRLLAESAKCEEMHWPSDENAYQAYQKSMIIASQLTDRWQCRPRPLVIERAFSVEFAGMRVRGRIDQIRIDPDPHGQVLVDLTDLKTGKQMMTQMEAFIQAFLYFEACHLDPQLPIPDLVTFWMARHNKPQHGRIDRERHSRLAERILSSVARRIESGDVAPHYGYWCKSCDFAALCEAEISMWEPGTESMALELVTADAA